MPSNHITHLLLGSLLTLSLDARVFRIGYISGSRRNVEKSAYDRPGYQISGAISLAVDQINQHHPDLLLANHTLEFEYAETFGSEVESIKHTARLSLSNVSAIIGPQETCFHEARLASAFKTLMLSYFCQHTFKDSSNQAQYSTFVNVRPPAAQISKSIVSLLLKYKWRKITFVYNYNTQAEESTARLRTAESIKKTLEEHGIEVLQSRTWPDQFYVGFEEDEINPFVSPFNKIIQETKQNTRIYVVVGDLDSHVGFMNAMEDEQLLDQGDYFVVGVYLDQYKPDDPAKYLRGLFETNVSKKSIKAFRSFLGVIPTPSKDKKFIEFNTEVNRYLARPPFNFTWDPTGPATQKIVRPEAAYLHDAVFIYARALDACLKNPTDCPDPSDGTKLVQYIVDKSYNSVLGYGGYIDASGEAHGNYSLLALKEQLNGQVWKLGLADIGIFRLNNNKSQLPTLVLKDGEQINWPMGLVPADEPECRFDNSKCLAPPDDDNKTIIMGVGVATLGIIAVFLMWIFFRHWKYERDLVSVLWKIKWEDLQVDNVTAYLRNSLDPDYEVRTASLTSIATLFDIDYTDLRVANLNTEMGIYKKQIVAVKRLKKRHIDLNRREIKKELKTMRELRYENLCGFIGACVEPVVCIITEYCQRGSLKDILYDENCAVDDIFVSSLVTDLVKGMCYIHSSPLKSHGSLKPTNCLVDSRWVLKITDYGLHEFKRKSDHSTNRRNDEAFFGRLLWTAPELLRMHYPPPEGTQAADVYSFAIILYEVYGRSGPFGNTSLTAKETVEQLREPFSLGEPHRPPIQSLPTAVQDVVISAMMDCWNESPELRPDFTTIKIRLKPIQRGVKTNIMDNVMWLLQRYAANLEGLVGERTVQLQEEKKKTETLLYEILPRPVAEHLIKDQKVEAEQFECVTIFFSDIVGFTAISADSTPLEVVALLNDLYTLFDSLLEQYDAYKVETIGDSYMVCSGLPIRNGERHAGVIASMALHLLDAIKTFRIRHRPNQPLLLRVGMHSGPVVAGVVGLKMPRYCLFGDTVNTTSRFESTGEAMKIHCSPQSKQILDDLGGYILEPRGLVHMKGKGDQLTYWLTDEDPLVKLQRQQHDFSSINQPSPLLAKWGSQSHPKRRLSCLKSRPSPTASPIQSKGNLNSDSTFVCDPIEEEDPRNGHLQGSLPNILKSINSSLASQYVTFQNGDAGKPLLYDQDYIRSETRSANCSRSGSYEMLSVPEHSILVLSN